MKLYACTFRTCIVLFLLVITALTKIADLPVNINQLEICDFGNVTNAWKPELWTLISADKEIGERCVASEQCRNLLAVCRWNNTRGCVCQCKNYYRTIKNGNTTECKQLVTESAVDKYNEIYKASMVALACFILAVLGITGLFVCNRWVLARRMEPLSNIDDSDRHREDSLFTVCDQLALERLGDKPPSYEDVASRDQQIHGSPPPLYELAVPTRISAIGRQNQDQSSNHVMEHRNIEVTSHNQRTLFRVNFSAIGRENRAFVPDSDSENNASTTHL